VDIVRVKDNDITLFEFCGTAAGVQIVSVTNKLTLDLVAFKKFNAARGFLLEYQGKERKRKKSRALAKCREHVGYYATFNPRITFQ
jgi:hypothetical protein